MKPYIFFIIALFLINENFAQPTIVKWSLAPGGGKQQNNTSVYTAGELANRETDVTAIHLSEGFLSMDFTALLDVKDYEDLPGVAAYPNPVEDYLQLSLPEGQLEIVVYDFNGKEIFRNTYTEQQTVRLDWSGYARGTYLVGVIDRINEKYRLFKVQKK